MPERTHAATQARTLPEALDQLLGDYRESRLEQVAYPHTLSARGWRMCLRYTICVIGGAAAMARVKEIDESYPLPDGVEP
jgi:hypothetical protein